MSITPEMDRALKREADVKRLVEAARNAVPMMQMAWKQYGVGGMFECMDALRSSLAPFAAERGGAVVKESLTAAAPTTGRNAPMYDPADVAFKPAKRTEDYYEDDTPAPSPSLPTPEDVAEMTTVVTCGDRIALIGNTPIDAAKFVEDQMKAGSWGYTVHLIPQSLCRCIIIAERDHAAVTATLRAEVERLEQLRKDYAAVNEDQRATIDSLEAKLAEADEFGRNRCKAADQEIQSLNEKIVNRDALLSDLRYALGTAHRRSGEYEAKLAAGGGKQTTFTVQEVAEYLSLLLESARALAAKGADRGE